MRNFRIYWLGMFISLIGTWLQNVALSWLVFELTQSAFLLGVVGFLSSIPIFFLSLLGGVVADRVSRRNIMILTQALFMGLAFILALFTQFKLITVSQIMAFALLNGVIMAFDAPARQALVAELVGKAHLMNAIALNSASFNSARIIGPALAGIFVAAIGMSGCFYLNGISFLAVLVALLGIKIEGGAKVKPRGHLRQDFIDGLKFIKHNPLILMLLSMAGMISLFGISYVILMPVFAADILRSGVNGLAMLMSSAGLGALAAALWLARLGDFRRKGRLLILSSLLFSLFLVIFALSKVFVISLIALVFTGGFGIMSVSIVNTILQVTVPDEFRGRVMSAFMFTFAGALPFGNLIAGTAAHAIGVALTVAISGVICGLFFLGVGVFLPRLREI